MLWLANWLLSPEFVLSCSICLSLCCVDFANILVWDYFAKSLFAINQTLVSFRNYVDHSAIQVYVQDDYYFRFHLSSSQDFFGFLFSLLFRSVMRLPFGLYVT